MIPLLFAFGLVCAPAPQSWPRPHQRLSCGPLTLEVYLSETAHAFHLVDQLSEWDNACHGQYRRNMSLSDEDEEALARYAEVRARRRWGQGLEQTFYVPLGLEKAASAGAKAGQVRDDELAVILPVLERFAPRARALMESKREVLESAFADIDLERLSEAAEHLARFTDIKSLTLPVFPLASPEPGGGGMDGGRLRWELHEKSVSFSVLLHECTHGFFQHRSEDLQAVVERTPGLTMTLIGEGFAYGMAPGLYSDGDDSLARNVARDLKREEPWEHGGYEWQRAFGLALRPHLAEALEQRQSLEEFLPRTRDAFLALQEVLLSRERGGPPKLVLAGPLGDIPRARLLDSRYHLWIHWINHSADKYAGVLGKLGPGDLLVLLVAGDDEQRIPVAYEHLSPLTTDEIQRRLRARKLIEEESTKLGGYRVVLLAAPTTEALRKLAAGSDLLHD
jgi:hypothetical protein